MAQNVLEDLLAQEQAKMEEYELAHQAALAQLDQIECDMRLQSGIVRGVKMAIERLAGQPAQG